VPGSAKLNGAAIAIQPAQAGADLPQLRLVRPAGTNQYSFEVAGVAPDAAINRWCALARQAQCCAKHPAAEIRWTGNEQTSAETSAEVLVEAAATVPANTPHDDPTQLVEILPYDEAWLAAAQPGVNGCTRRNLPAGAANNQGRPEICSGPDRTAGTERRGCQPALL